jgi:hypothetical protein
MNRKFIAFLLLSLPLFSAAQKKDKAAKKAAAVITTDALKKHLYIIASKEMEGRDTPSPGLEKAADYIETHFKSLGLMPGNNGSYRQYYPLYKDGAITSSLIVNGNTIQLNNDYQNISSPQSYDKSFSEVVFAGYGIKDSSRNDYANINVAGKLVVILDGAPSGYKPASTDRGSNAPAAAMGKVNTAAKQGAAGLMIVYNNYPRKGPLSQPRWSPREPVAAGAAGMAISISEKLAESIMGEDGNKIFEKVKAGTLVMKTYPAAIKFTCSKTIETSRAPNVIAVLEGTDLKNEYVFITGHMDHLGKRNDTTIYYGADDDGSGTTGVMQLATAFAKAKQNGKGPRRSIVFMTVSGEEKGLWGSAYYANHPIFPLEKTTVDLNIDMIGRTDASRKQGDSSNYVYVVGDDKISSDLKVISEAANNTYLKMELDYKFNDPKDPNRIYFRSDHYNFAEKGVPIIFYYDGMLGADYHKPTDTPDKINYELMKKRAQLVFYTAWEMANRDDMLKRDIKLEAPRGF